MADATTGQATQRWCACCDAWIEVPTAVDHAFEDDEAGTR